MGQKSSGSGKKTSESIGERLQAVHETCVELESRIRRRLRGKFRAIECSHDLDDVLASTRRRVIAAVTNGSVAFASDSELEGYIWRIAYRVVIDALNRERREREAQHALRNQCQDTATEVPRSYDTEWLADALSRVDEDDRTMILLWGMHLSPVTRAEALGLTLECYRSRWRRLRERLRQIGLAEPFD